MAPSLSPTTQRAIEHLEFTETPATDFQGLTKLYRAWRLAVPFDNIRKMIALFTKADGALPGITANDFLTAWIEHGTGGTCWPTNNTLFTILSELGFDAIRITGSMWDNGIDNHASIIVRMDGQDWLTDASLSTLTPLPLIHGQTYISEEPLYKAEVDPEGDAFFIWTIHHPLPHLLPCRLLDRDVPETLFASNFERSREISPFNAKLYARRNFEDQIRTLSGNKLFVATASGQVVTELSEAQLMQELREKFGYSQTILNAWAESGALAATITPTEPPRPPLTRTPPSERN